VTIRYGALGQAGRLGNQLWEIASTIGIAAKQGRMASFPPWEYQMYFSIPEEFFHDEPGQDATQFAEHLDPRAQPYLQDYGLWKDHAALIREFFSPSQRALERLFDEDLTWFWHMGEKISLHVRRGDNVTHPPGFHPLRSLDYYQAATATLPELPVVVFSDDIPWCQEHLPAALDRELHYYEGVTRPREYLDRQKYLDSPVLDWIDLFLMRACDHHVISNSTYAWWGAFLSGDPAPIYPSNWFGRKISSYTDASLMFPPHWRELPDPTAGP
jgi:hypothetical protein